jgi:hypothetical protein
MDLDRAIVRASKFQRATIRASYLESVDSTRVQAAHLDFPESEIFDFDGDTILGHKKRIPMIGLCPLTPFGCFIQVWPSDVGTYTNPEMECKGTILHIPFGVVVLLPGHCVHGGGFLWRGIRSGTDRGEMDKGDLRLRFCIYPDGIMIDQNNVFLSSEKYLDALNTRQLVDAGFHFKFRDSPK